MGETLIKAGKKRALILTFLIAPVFALPLAAHRISLSRLHARQTGHDAKQAAKRALKAFFPAGSRAIAPTSRLLAKLDDPRINESSGLAASSRNPGFLYTHNDSGDGAFVFAIDRSGHTKARFHLQNAHNVDWEDMAVGPSQHSGHTAIYAGDTGNNNLDRSVMTIYRVDEPNLGTIKKTLRDDVPLNGVETFQYRYPDGNHDCETVMVHPRTGEIILVSKERDGHSGIYSLPVPLSKSGVMTAKKIGAFTFQNTFFSGDDKLGRGERQATGGAISPDGTHLVIRTYIKGYQWKLSAGKSISQTLKSAPQEFMLPLTKQGESICYRHDNGAILMTSEGANPPLYEMSVP